MRTFAGRTSAWAIQTREIVYMAIGAALYAVLGSISVPLRLPGAFNVQVRPAIVIPMFFGAVFGPWVGFFAGFVGNIIIDLISGFGFTYWYWSLGNGLLGLISGFAFVTARDRELPRLGPVMIWSLIGILLGLLFSSLFDIWATGITLAASLTQWAQAVGVNAIAWAILLPILYVGYKQVQERSGR